MPASVGELVSLLHTAFGQLAGVDLLSNSASSVYRDSLAHGGMSSWMISLDAWRERPIPLLAQHARILLAAER
jgi:hypothetical protein